MHNLFIYHSVAPEVEQRTKLMVGIINKKMKNKILEIHSEWLKQNGYNKEYKDCVKQSKELKRTCVQVTPRASLCTSIYDL